MAHTAKVLLTFKEHRLGEDTSNPGGRKTMFVQTITKRTRDLETSKNTALLQVEKWFMKLHSSYEEIKCEVNSLARSELECLQRAIGDIQCVSGQDISLICFYFFVLRFHCSMFSNHELYLNFLFSVK